MTAVIIWATVGMLVLDGILLLLLKLFRRIAKPTLEPEFRRAEWEEPQHVKLSKEPVNHAKD